MLLLGTRQLDFKDVAGKPLLGFLCVLANTRKAHNNGSLLSRRS